MAAERKVQHTENQSAEQARADNAERAVNLADHDAPAAESPARALQEHLEQSISGEKKVSSVYDMGRILAASSGITAILGVFIFSGLW